MNQGQIVPHYKYGAICHSMAMFDIENCSTCQAILSCGANLIVMWSNFDSHDKQNCHEKQNCSTWKVLLTDNVCGVCDKYDVREDTLTNVDISQGFKIGNKQEIFLDGVPHHQWFNGHKCQNYHEWPSDCMQKIWICSLLRDNWRLIGWALIVLARQVQNNCE